MLTRELAIAAVLLAACEAPVAGGAAALSDDALPRGASIVEARGELELVAATAPLGPPGTDIRPPRPMGVREAGVYRAAPVPVWAGALVADGVAWVATDGTLLFESGRGAPARELAHDVIPELDVSADGRTLAFAKRPGPGAGVWVWDGETARCVTPGLAIADRPRFVDAHRLVVVGAPRGGVSGVHLARWDGSFATPVAITNAGLRVGAPFGPTFVPPPATHASMRIEAGVLVYEDGTREQRIALSQGGTP